MTAVFLVLSAFLASAVEFVEALTIVLAAGLTRGWRSSLTGLGAATVALAAIVAALGPTLKLVPIDALRLVGVCDAIAIGVEDPDVKEAVVILTHEDHVRARRQHLGAIAPGHQS